VLAALAASDLCDDLRARSGASGFPRGTWDRNPRERSEDGAGDYIPRQTNLKSVRENMVGTVSEW
jgi:hypothetical protein